MTKICVVPQVSGVGGMVSFRYKFTKGLQSRGIDVTHNLNEAGIDAVLVIGGTRMLTSLWQIKRKGIPVVQRLNGMNWVHRVRNTGVRHYLRSEYGNFILQTIRSRIATRIVYQSQFSQSWWESVYGLVNAQTKVVYNGIDLDIFTPLGNEQPPDEEYRILLVEGSLMGGYDMGLKTALELAEAVKQRLTGKRRVSLSVVGKVSDLMKQKVMAGHTTRLHWMGVVPHEQVPSIDRSAHVLFSADVNAACPNSVIEALGCGLPVVSFDTGALKELVGDQAGRIVSYGGDAWKLEPPDVDGLAEATLDVLRDQKRFRQAARERAENLFGLDTMVNGYLEMLLG